MRHHFHILQGFAAQGNLKDLASYLDEAQGSIPVIFALDLPTQIPVPETDLCSVLSNLLENAMEIGLKTTPGRR